MCVGLGAATADGPYAHSRPRAEVVDAARAVRHVAHDQRRYARKVLPGNAQSKITAIPAAKNPQKAIGFATTNKQHPIKNKHGGTLSQSPSHYHHGASKRAARNGGVLRADSHCPGSKRIKTNKPTNQQTNNHHTARADAGPQVGSRLLPGAHKMSARVVANMSSPSGSWSATLVALASLTRQIVL